MGRYKMNLQLLIYKLFNDYRLLTNNLYFGYYPLFVVISIILKSLFLVFQWYHPFPYLSYHNPMKLSIKITAGVLIRRLYKERRKEWGPLTIRGLLLGRITGAFFCCRSNKIFFKHFVYRRRSFFLCTRNNENLFVS